MTPSPRTSRTPPRLTVVRGFPARAFPSASTSPGHGYSHPVRSPRPAASLGLARSASPGGFWGERQERNASATIAHIEHWLERDRLARQLRPAAADGLHGRAGAAGSSPTPRSTSSPRRWPGSSAGAGDAELDAHRRAGRAGRRRAGAGRLPEHRVRPARPAAPLQRPRAGATSSTATATCCRPLSRARARRRPDDARRRRPPRRRPRLRRVRPDGSDGICGHPEIETGAGRAVPRHRRAALPRPGRASSSSGAGTAPCPTSSSAAPTSRTTSRCATATCSAGTRSARCTSPPARSTWPSRPATTKLLAAVVRAVGRAPSPRRTYLTGGMGSRHQDEAFGDDFELPPDRAYSETCAASPPSCSPGGCCSPPAARYADLDRAHPLQRRRHLARTGRSRLLLRQPAAPARARRGRRPVRRRNPRAGVAAGAVVRRLVLPDQRGPPARHPRRLPRHRGRRRVQLHQYAPCETDRAARRRRGRGSSPTDYPAAGAVRGPGQEAPERGRGR